MRWINIPLFSQPGQLHAFADREELVTSLYGELVHAGNSVVGGNAHVRVRHVVTGYKGVGKSALLLQVLAMIRDELATPDGSRVPVPAEVPTPDEPHRWIMLRVSGKHVGSVDGMADDLRASMLAVLGETERQARDAVPGTPALGWFHRMLSKEQRLYQVVRARLAEAQKTVEFVRAWQGANRVDTSRARTDASQTTTQQLDVKAIADGFARVGMDTTSAEAKIALGFAAGFIARWSSELGRETSLERRSVVGADLVVDVLNPFFHAAAQAGLPTLLVLDDFDEFASSAGPSHAERAKIIQQVLGFFGRLEPTCLVLALRQEYAHEDIFRQWTKIFVPLLSRARTRDMVRAWMAVQKPDWTADEVESAVVLGDELLSPFSEDAAVVVPYNFLEYLKWASQNSRAGEALPARMRRFFASSQPGEVVRLIERLVERMSDDDVLNVAEGTPVDPSPYGLQPRERLPLEREGLLRAPVAGDASDDRLVISPLIAYLAAAKRQPSAPRS